MISNLVNLSDLQAKNAAAARLASKSGAIVLPGHTAPASFTPPTSGYNALMNNSLNGSSSLATRQAPSTLSLPGRQINQQSGLLGRTPPPSSTQASYAASPSQALASSTPYYGGSATVGGSTGPASTQQSTNTSQTASRGLFPSVVSSLAARGTTPNTTAQQYTQQSVDYGAGSIPIASQAQEIANRFGQRYAEVGQAGAKFQAGQLTTGTTPVAEGNAAITAQTTAAQQQALAQGQQAALQGIGYELTGQSQAQAAANAAAGQAYTGQGLQQNALSSAAGYAQPQVGQPGQAFYNPVEQSTAGGISPEIMQQYAQMAANGQIAGVPSMITSNPVLNAQLNAAAKAINPNYNPVTSAAQSGVLTAQEEQVQAYRSALQQGQNLQSQLNDLISQFGLNPNDLRAANLAIQAIANQTSNPHYALLNNYINDVANTYSQVLTPPGGSATDYTRGLAASMLDGAKSGKSLVEIMQGLDNAAQAKIAGVQTITPSTSSASGGSVGWY